MMRASGDPLLQKPVARPQPPAVPQPPSQPAAEPAPAAATAPAAAAAPASSGVTLEFQRQQAKAMQQYFRDLKAERSAETGKVFGWTRRNEIRNGRWVMTGIAVGLLTEYATGVDMLEQIKVCDVELGRGGGLMCHLLVLAVDEWVSCWRELASTLLKHDLGLTFKTSLATYSSC